ncbi:MAG: hypothetical protein ACKOGA_14630, partial [Planctomycetaceae bacterium]
MFRREMTAGGWLVGRLVAACVAGALCLGATGEATAQSTDPWIVLEGKAGPGKGKHVVLVSGDEEYRSEETLPALAKILAERHG